VAVDRRRPEALVVAHHGLGLIGAVCRAWQRRQSVEFRSQASLYSAGPLTVYWSAVVPHLSALVHGKLGSAGDPHPTSHLEHVQQRLFHDPESVVPEVELGDLRFRDRH
jgi:hypothetical protein